jgi:hypothetical protein
MGEQSFNISQSNKLECTINYIVWKVKMKIVPNSPKVWEIMQMTLVIGVQTLAQTSSEKNNHRT